MCILCLKRLLDSQRSVYGGLERQDRLKFFVHIGNVRRFSHCKGKTQRLRQGECLSSAVGL